MKRFLLNLRAFDGEGGGAARSRCQEMRAQVPQAHPRPPLGIRRQGVIANTSEGENATHTEPSMSFDDYVKAHKDEATKWFQNAV